MTDKMKTARKGRPLITMKILRRIGIVIGALLGIPVLALIVVVALGITIPLDAFRADIEEAARDTLGRGVEIDGPIALVLALSPTVEVQRLRIANPPGWDTNAFVQLGRARGSVDLLPLLRREISIDAIAMDGGAIRLETRADGSNNWTFERATSKAPAPPGEGPAYEFVRLGELAVRSLSFEYHDAGSGETHALELEALDGSVERDAPIVLSARGLTRNQPFEVSLTGGTLAALSDPAQPWSLDVTASLADAVITLDGSIADPLKAQGVDLDIAVRGKRLEALESLTGLSIPPIGPYAVETHFARSETGYRISDLEGAIGNSTFRGSLLLDDLSGRPRLDGNLHIATLDVEPFLLDDSPPSIEPPARAAEPLDAKERADLLDFSLEGAAQAFESLQSFDADVTLIIDRVAGVGTDTRGVSLRAKLDDGGLTAPMAAIIADVPVDGQLTIQSSDSTLGFALELSSSGSDIGNLTAMAKREKQDLQGGFENFSLTASGRGRDLRAALESLDAIMTMGRADLSYGHQSEDEPVSLTLEDFELALPQGQALRLATKGTLLGRAFSVDFKSATVVEALSDKPLPIALTATGAGARLSLKGEVPKAGDLEGTTLDLDLKGDRIGDLAEWIGSAPKARASYGVSGTLTFEEYKTKVESLRVNLGRTVVTGAVSASRRDPGLLLDARLRSSVVDPAELEAMFPQRQEPAGPDDKPGLNLYMPIMPYGVTIADADLDIAVGRVRLQPVDATNVTFKGRVRDGHLKPSPFTVRIGKVPFTGRFGLDLRSQVPVATVIVRSEDVDVGGLLTDLEVFEGSETKARRVEVRMTLRGSNLKTAIQKSEISAKLEDGVTIVRDPNTQTPLEIQVVKSTLSSSPGQPIKYLVDGRVKNVPVTIEIETEPLATFIESTERVPVRLTAGAAGVQVQMNANLRRPFSLRNLSFDLAVEGNRLDSLDELLHLSTPPWGPYEIGGTFQLDHVGYHAPSIAIRVGDSHLIGSVSLDTSGTRPRLAVDLKGKTLQLNDFRGGQWSAFEYVEPIERSGEGESQSNPVEGGKATVRALLGSESMRAMDARVSLAVNEVLSGEDGLGRGHLVATLEHGRLSLDPIRVEIPEGSADARISLEMTEHHVTTSTKVKIEHLDYGVLARRIDPAATPAGWLSLDVDLQSRTEKIETMLEGASGHFDFAVWPTNMQADAFDLWASNLLLALLPRLDPESGPVINCVVGVFDTTDGIMKPKRLLIDTTNVQVWGEGQIDLGAKEIDVLLVPNAKRPRMFSVATPIRVTGNYSDLQTGASPDQWLRSAARFITSIFAPIQRLFTTPIPADGEAECVAAMERSSQ
jgi:uncharacterized protein involved in outer membrane biogenesis